MCDVFVPMDLPVSPSASPPAAPGSLSESNSAPAPRRVIIKESRQRVSKPMLSTRPAWAIRSVLDVHESPNLMETRSTRRIRLTRYFRLIAGIASLAVLAYPSANAAAQEQVPPAHAQTHSAPAQSQAAPAQEP